MTITLDEAQDKALAALAYIVENGKDRDRIQAAALLLSPILSLDDDGPDIIVDEEDAPYVPCDCEWCVGPGGDAIDEAINDNLGLIFTYGVFGQ